MASSTLHEFRVEHVFDSKGMCGSLRTHLRIFDPAAPSARRRGMHSAQFAPSFGRICGKPAFQTLPPADVACIPLNSPPPSDAFAANRPSRPFLTDDAARFSTQSVFFMDASARETTPRALFPQMRPAGRRIAGSGWWFAVANKYPSFCSQHETRVHQSEQNAPLLFATGTLRSRCGCISSLFCLRRGTEGPQR